MSTLQGIVLIGASGTGRSSVGYVLAQHLGVEFHDVDAMVEAELGKSIHDLVIEGHPLFEERRRAVAVESLRAVESVIGAEGQTLIVALGASQIFDDSIVQLLEKLKAGGQAHIVTLVADSATVLRREGLNVAQPVPLGAPRAMLNAMLKQHRARGEELATVVVDTSLKTIDQVVEELEAACKIATA